MILKKAKISADLVFEGSDFYTNKLYSRETSIEIAVGGEVTLILDYSHYCRWTSAKRSEPEFTDYTKLFNHLDEVKKIWINDVTIAKKLQDLGAVNFVELKVTANKSGLFHVIAQNSQSPGYILLGVEKQ